MSTVLYVTAVHAAFRSSYSFCMNAGISLTFFIILWACCEISRGIHLRGQFVVNPKTFHLLISEPIVVTGSLKVFAMGSVAFPIHVLFNNVVPENFWKLLQLHHDCCGKSSKPLPFIMTPITICLRTIFAAFMYTVFFFFLNI